MKDSLNVIGTPLKPCSFAPVTGWYRDGYCNTDAHDRGVHTVCALVTEDFLLCLAEQGNDLMTPQPHFPGLKPGDSWCVCAGSWLAAVNKGRGCLIHLESTHAATLELVPLDTLLAHAVAAEGPSA